MTVKEMLEELLKDESRDEFVEKSISSYGLVIEGVSWSTILKSFLDDLVSKVLEKTGHTEISTATMAFSLPTEAKTHHAGITRDPGIGFILEAYYNKGSRTPGLAVNYSSFSSLLDLTLSAKTEIVKEILYSIYRPSLINLSIVLDSYENIKDISNRLTERYLVDRLHNHLEGEKTKKAITNELSLRGITGNVLEDTLSSSVFSKEVRDGATFDLDAQIIEHNETTNSSLLVLSYFKAKKVLNRYVEFETEDRTKWSGLIAYLRAEDRYTNPLESSKTRQDLFVTATSSITSHTFSTEFDRWSMNRTVSGSALDVRREYDPGESVVAMTYSGLRLPDGFIKPVKAEAALAALVKEVEEVSNGRGELNLGGSNLYSVLGTARVVRLKEPDDEGSTD